MSEGWDSFLCSIDDHPASVFVDLTLKDLAPDARRPHLLRVALPLTIPTFDGLSQQSEAPRLYALEDELFDTVSRNLRARYVGRVTTQGHREHFYYAATTDGLEEAAHAALLKFPEYPATVLLQEDRHWRVYLDRLYPDELDLVLIRTRELIERLASQGVDLSQARPLEHFLHFPSEESRLQFLEQIENEGFEPQELELEESGDVEMPYGLYLVRHDRCDHLFLDGLVTDLFLRSQDCGGVYIGWQAGNV